MRNEDKKFIKAERAGLIKTLFSRSGITTLPDYGDIVKQYRAKSSLESSQYFYDKIIERRSLVRQGDKRNTLIGYFCNLVPEEIILACGAAPVRLCTADSACAQAGEELTGGDICPIIKSIMGGAYNGEFDKIDFVVIPSSCDGKTKMAEVLSPVKEVYFLDLPSNSDYLENVEIWVQKFEGLHLFLQKRLQRKATRKELLKACELTNRRTETFRKIYNFRLNHPHIINPYDYFAVTYASFFADPSEWTGSLERLYLEAQRMKNRPGRPKTKRLLLSGAPIIFPNFKLLEIVEEAGCDISADTLCSAYGRLYDPVQIDEETEAGILRSLALKYIAASMCPCFLGIDKLIDYIIDTVRKYSLDGVIYYNLRLCQPFELQTGLIRHTLKENGIPFLSVKTDLGKEDTGQLKTRIEAFLEMLR